MIRWLKSMFAWRLVAEHGRWAYFENEITGDRCAELRFVGGYIPRHPAHDRWLAGGDWSYEMPKPPRSQSGVKRANGSAGGNVA